MRLLRSLPVFGAVYLLSTLAIAAEPPAALAKQARAILAEHCYSCHGEGGAAEGGVNYVLNVPRLISRGKLLAGNAVKSKLYTQVKTGNMPKDGEPLGKADIETLKQWIDAGAPDFNPPVAKREFISPVKMFEFIKVDLEAIDSRKRPLIRYFAFTNLYNAGLSDDELATYRNGLAKLINSLSWAPDIAVPKPIDPAKTIFRLDIGDVEWSAATWDRILAENPFGVMYDSAAATACYKHCATTQPFVRGDWFVARASIPPLYHDILELPKTDLELEKKLQVDVKRNLQTDRAARAGFNGSGVSNNNRLIERHRSNLTRGAYWKSYDFGGSDGTKNLFANPAGQNGQDTFAADGGELIFSLPNGLQGYMLIDAKGERIDKGPINVVSDPKRPDKAVVNGLSCMSCHAKGMIEKTDQVRPAVLGNPNGYTAEVLATVRALYLPEDDFAKLLAQDKDRFAKAVEATGAALGETEPIVTLALRFEEVLDLPLAAAEVGVSPDEFVKSLAQSSKLASIFGTLKVPGGTVQREVCLANFALIVRELKLGEFIGKGRDSFIATRAGDVWNGNGLNMKFCWCPAGMFMMGSPTSEPNRGSNEAQVSVTLTRGFWLSQHEVTQEEWQSVMGTTIRQQKAKPYSYGNITGTGSRHPMYFVNHDEATEFCVKWTESERRAGRLPTGWEYRLPTQAQWEYACRAGTTSATAFGNDLSSAQANFNGDDPYNGAAKGPNLRATKEIGSYKANGWGFYDMHGNVWEWCRDGYVEKLLGGRDPETPKTSKQPSIRVIRGGSYVNDGRGCRSANRDKYDPNHRLDTVGFRPALVRVSQ